MAKQILVPLKRKDRIEEIIPCVGRIAQPGMKVVFLFRYPLDGFGGYLRAGMATGETGVLNPTLVRKIGESFTWEGQLRLAEERVLPACEALQKKGAKVSVDFHTGSWKKAVPGYALKGDVHLIMTRAGTGLGIKKFLHDLVSTFGLVKQPSSSPMRVVHPGALL